MRIKQRGLSLISLSFAILVLSIITVGGIEFISSYGEAQKVSETVETLDRIQRKAKSTDLAILNFKESHNFQETHNRIAKQNNKIYLLPLRNEITSERFQSESGANETGYIALHDVSTKYCVGLVSKLAPRFYETFVVPHERVHFGSLGTSGDLRYLVGLSPSPSVGEKDPRSKVNATRLINLCSDTNETKTKDLVFFLRNEYDPTAFQGEELNKKIRDVEQRLDNGKKNGRFTLAEFKDDEGETYQDYKEPEARAMQNHLGQLKILQEKREKMKTEHERAIKLRESNQALLDDIEGKREASGIIRVH